jgi:aspartate aminotransferase
MSISEKVRRGMANGSYIRKMFEEGIALKKVYGNDKVFDLTIGNPTIEPPEDFSRELKALVEKPSPGMHRYMENAGYTDTRAAIAAKLTAETGVRFTQQEIVMTCGAAGAINLAFKALLNPGEEVISFAPFFFEYEVYADNHGGICKVLPSDGNFIPDFNALETGITPKTKAVIINSPNNPSGIVYSDSVLKTIADVVARKSSELKTRVYIVSDDVYSKLYYGEGKCPRIMHYYPHTIVVTSYSKELSLPGERIGYAAVHPDCEEVRDVVSGLIYANRVLGFVNAPALMQNVVRNLQNASVSVSEYKKKRDFLFTSLTRMGYSMTKPEGAFYIFPKTPIKDDLAFVNELKQMLVLTVPGSAFRTPGYMRLSYCLDDKIIEGSLPAFEKAIKKYKNNVKRANNDFPF